MQSLTTDQGTAMPESTLCDKHFEESRATDRALDAAKQSADWDGSEWFQDVIGNESVSCIICGKQDEQEN